MNRLALSAKLWPIVVARKARGFLKIYLHCLRSIWPIVLAHEVRDFLKIYLHCLRSIWPIVLARLLSLYSVLNNCAPVVGCAMETYFNVLQVRRLAMVRIPRGVRTDT